MLSSHVMFSRTNARFRTGLRKSALNPA